ncbi:MAG: hypothetical protein A3G41_04420 [Elusimicrobia bacterium RIFCSPLOWO2_12_FULL_59_9]|nr:MAG: hypothetical protein A3G41_04420 [Elusimicrobia bacterium RIFCSPLOWO2_12_FULL_59_9]
MNKTRLYLAGMTAIVIASGIAAQAEKLSKKDEPLIFNDAQAQTEQFIRYNKTIKLSATQRKIKAKVLGSIPAPCCKDYSIATCCCPCNLAKGVWGLSHHLIAERKYSSKQVRQEVLRWMAFINPTGFSGDACYTGGCSRPFSKNGCGGMDEKHVAAD